MWARVKAVCVRPAVELRWRKTRTEGRKEYKRWWEVIDLSTWSRLAQESWDFRLDSSQPCGRWADWQREGNGWINGWELRSNKCFEGVASGACRSAIDKKQVSHPATIRLALSEMSTKAVLARWIGGAKLPPLCWSGSRLRLEPALQQTTCRGGLIHSQRDVHLSGPQRPCLNFVDQQFRRLILLTAGIRNTDCRQLIKCQHCHRLIQSQCHAPSSPARHL